MVERTERTSPPILVQLFLDLNNITLDKRQVIGLNRRHTARTLAVRFAENIEGT
jgi:hypothetical protein